MIPTPTKFNITDSEAIDERKKLVFKLRVEMDVDLVRGKEGLVNIVHPRTMNLPHQPTRLCRRNPNTYQQCKMEKTERELLNFYPRYHDPKRNEP